MTRHRFHDVSFINLTWLEVVWIERTTDHKLSREWKLTNWIYYRVKTQGLYNIRRKKIEHAREYHEKEIYFIYIFKKIPTQKAQVQTSSSPILKILIWSNLKASPAKNIRCQMKVSYDGQ